MAVVCEAGTRPDVPWARSRYDIGEAGAGQAARGVAQRLYDPEVENTVTTCDGGIGGPNVN